MEPRQNGRWSPGSVKVVLFSGGRGSSVLAEPLIGQPSIALTLAINGYDDGASTGEVRRFLGDCLGPSDFRKNAGRLGRRLRPAHAALPDLLEWRLPAGCTAAEGRHAMQRLAGADGADDPHWLGDALSLAGRLDAPTRSALTRRLESFLHELDRSSRGFTFSDCSLGNLVFAGSFLACGRRFNAAVDDYCALLGLPEGLLENVTDGRNAFLVALDPAERLVASEEEIVDGRHRGGVREIFLVDRVPDAAERGALDADGPDATLAWLAEHQAPVGANARLLSRLREADFIIYAPGTQHSSLFPSYLTPGVSETIAANYHALKLLITNIQTDAEIVGQSAVDLIDRAVYYLNGKGARHLPRPVLITHALLNDPRAADSGTPYVPLGRLERLEDPRLVRIANYEDGVTGRHDATKVLIPFVESFRARHPSKVAVLLHDASSANKVAQTMVEMVRGGIEDLHVELTVFYSAALPLDATFTSRLPFAVRPVEPGAASPFRHLLRAEAFDYVVLFESSGMYRGEDIVGLVSYLVAVRLDAVWGSRRLSVRDIEESYRLRYRHNALLGAASAIGSHALSACCLLLYGRYVSDTLSGVRAVRTVYLDERIDVFDKLANHQLLAAVLRNRGDLLEVPVQFLPLSPDRIKRTTIWDGLRALGALLGARLRRRAGSHGRAAGPRPATAVRDDRATSRRA